MNEFDEEAFIKENIKLNWIEIVVLYVLPMSILLIILVLGSFLILYPHLLLFYVKDKSFGYFWKPLMQPCFGIYILSLLCLIVYEVQSLLRYMAIKEIGKLFNEKRYQEVLDLLNKESDFKESHTFRKNQRLELFVKYQVESLAQTGRIKEAVILMATEMCSIYRCEGFPEELLKKWFALYASCEPIPVEEFYYCSTCGLHPSTIDLFDITMDNGYPPPIGYRHSVRY